MTIDEAQARIAALEDALRTIANGRVLLASIADGWREVTRLRGLAKDALRSEPLPSKENLL